MKCTCGNPNCLICLSFDTASGTVMLRGKDGNESLMYLDIKTINGIIQHLEEMRRNLAEEMAIETGVILQ